MAYPNAEDYVRAVQHPERVFRVPALRGAVFELHPLFGIPMPASGNAAVVFKAAVAGEDTALRFFIREDASSRERYTALGQHIADRGIGACVARATWVDDAISVHGSGWPMIEMNWVNGRTLDAYVGHLAETVNVNALSCLAETWRKFVAQVQAAEFAHGDLQHGNVLIDAASTVRLVDFDGSWIAAFHEGPPPNETGHPNYQRTGREWGRWMDTFPGLVIYTALLTLSKRPDFWAKLHNGENILFSAEDFAPPFHTRTWQFLAGIHDAEVNLAAERLKLSCEPSWRADDTLESLLEQYPRIEVADHAQPVEATPFPGVGVPKDKAMHWWDVTGPPAAGPSGPPARPPAWASPSDGFTMPPPPPKTEPGVATQQSPSFAGTGPAKAWYSPTRPGPRSQPGSLPQSAPRRPPGRRRAGAATAMLVLAIAVLTALVVGVIVRSGAAAFVSAVIAAGIALPLLLRRT